MEKDREEKEKNKFSGTINYVQYPNVDVYREHFGYEIDVQTKLTPSDDG